MNIKENSKDYPLPFGVCAEFNSRLGDMSLHKLTLTIQGTLVELNTEECTELLNVVNGKKCNTVVLREENDYMPHIVIYNSKPENTESCVFSVE
jgi:hypothetical protein